MLPEKLLSVLRYPLCMPSSYPPLRLRSGQAFRKVREGTEHPRLWWLMQFEGRATPPDKDGVPALLSFTSWAATPAAQGLRGGSTQRAGHSVHRYVR